MPKTRPDDPARAGKLTKTRPENFSFFIENRSLDLLIRPENLEIKTDYLNEFDF